LPSADGASAGSLALAALLPRLWSYDARHGATAPPEELIEAR
jgi:hypothetical protein